MTETWQTQPDWQPLLTGETVILRPTRPDDRAEMFIANADPLIWAVHPLPERYQEAPFNAFFDDALASGGSLTIIERATGAIIGSSRYHGFDPECGEVEIGWTFLVRRHWGGATNAQVKRLMLDHAFQWANCVIFKVGAANWRSRGAMAKIGGRLREGEIEIIRNGAPMPYVVFEIRKADRGAA